MGAADDLREQGPIVVGQLLPDDVTRERLRREGRASAPITVHLLVDTGAAISGVGHDVAQALSLDHDDELPIVSVTQVTFRAPLFSAELLLWFEGDGPPRDVRIPLDLVGLPPSESGAYQGILGRDFLEQFRLVYDGPDGRFELYDRD